MYVSNSLTSWSYNNYKRNIAVAASYDNTVAPTNFGCIGAKAGSQLIETFALMKKMGNTIPYMRATICIVLNTWIKSPGLVSITFIANIYDIIGNAMIHPLWMY